MLGILLCLLINHVINIADLAGLPSYIDLSHLKHWAVYVFGIVLPVLCILGCAACCICIVMRKRKQGNYNGMHSVFEVPVEYRFVKDADVEVQGDVEIEVQVN